jgi:gas vesicle protein
MSNQVVKKDTATALVAGALLGAGIVLLFTPQSGRQTRRKIRRFAEFAGDQAQAARRELQRSLEHIIEDTEDKLQAGLTSGMEWTESKLRELRKTLETAGKSIGEQIAKIQSS